MVTWDACAAVERVPWLLGGAWVFKGTRVPLYLFFDSLARGMSVDDFAMAHGVEKWKLETALEYAATGIEQLRLAANISPAAPEQLTATSEAVPKIGTKLRIYGTWFLVVWPFWPALTAAFVIYQAFDKLSHQAVGDMNVHEHMVQQAADGHLHMVSATTAGHFHTYHAAMIALLMAAILLLPFVAPANLSTRSAHWLKGLRTGFIATGTLANAYLWTVSDAGAYPWDPEFASLVGLLAFMLVFAALGISIMVAGVYRGAGRDQTI